jgi:hypothetical protein
MKNPTGMCRPWGQEKQVDSLLAATSARERPLLGLVCGARGGVDRRSNVWRRELTSRAVAVAGVCDDVLAVDGAGARAVTRALAIGASMAMVNVHAVGVIVTEPP